MAEESNEKLISVREAAKECGRNMETVRRWIWAGKLPAEKLGNQLFIKKSDLISYCRLPVQSVPAKAGETAVKYEAQDRTEVAARLERLKERIRARTGGDFTGEEIVGAIRGQREESVNKIEQDLVEGERIVKAGSRADLIKRMRKLREEIRARVGNLDAVGTVEQIRQERMNELTRLR